MNILKIKTISLFLVVLVTFGLFPILSAEEKEKEKLPELKFRVKIDLKRTEVKSQGRTGTCWAFAAISFLESEILRKTGKRVDLSEMYIVRHTYPRKAQRYIRYHGSSNFGSGGQAHDAIDTIRSQGLVPENVYPAIRKNQVKLDQLEMDRIIKSMLDAVLKGKRGKISIYWKDAIEAVLDVYLGGNVSYFTVDKKVFKPESYTSDYLMLNLDDYIELTSYNHHPFYKKINIELPDNWSGSLYYNLPIDDLEKVTDHALTKGYTLVWDGDTSDKGFKAKKQGYAILYEKDNFIKGAPFQESKITQADRQGTFDSLSTTDDHLMHIVGMAEDQYGNKYYTVKNSWGTGIANKGYLYMSRAYFRLNTTALMINRYSLSECMRKKLGIATD
jgi:bleomycin hydrolase